MNCELRQKGFTKSFQLDSRCLNLEQTEPMRSHPQLQKLSECHVMWGIRVLLCLVPAATRFNTAAPVATFSVLDCKSINCGMSMPTCKVHENLSFFVPTCVNVLKTAAVMWPKHRQSGVNTQNFMSAMLHQNRFCS